MSDKTKASIPQPAPVGGKRRVVEVVLRDFAERAESGREKYGTYLMTGNGRDALWDAYQEAIDLVVYLRQELMEREDAVYKAAIAELERLMSTSPSDDERINEVAEFIAEYEAMMFPINRPSPEDAAAFRQDQES